MKKNLTFLLSFVVFLSLTSLVLADTITLVNPLSGVNSFTDLITNIMNFLKTIIASLSILMFVIAGIMFVVSGGNPGKIEQAKKTAIYAAIGAAIALAGAGLVEVIKAVIGAPPS